MRPGGDTRSGLSGERTRPARLLRICIVAVAAMPAASLHRLHGRLRTANFAGASNAAIFLMLGFIGSMLAALAALAFT